MTNGAGLGCREAKAGEGSVKIGDGAAVRLRLTLTCGWSRAESKEHS
jgi:hypothetical protein